MNRAQQDALHLQALEKAVTTDTISALVPEDLEMEAHNTLWNETDPEELTLLKLIPQVKASQILHEFARVTSHGYSKNSGWFSDRTRPPETTFATERVTVKIKILGEVGPTFLLAHLEETIKALGTTGAQNQERVALRLNTLWKKNRQLYFSDTRKTRSGEDGLRAKGVLQQIDEGSSSLPEGSHVIDCEGQPLSLDLIRDKTARGIVNFGRANLMLMSPFARADFEGTMDPAHRINVPNQVNPYLIGQSIGGIQSQGGVTWFETDNTLSQEHSRWQYTTDLIEGAPSGTPTVSVVAAAVSSEVSKWDADSAGDIYWVVTQVVEELEGLGTRYPATLGTFTTVAVGEKATMTITPSSPSVESFRVYRGRDEDEQDALTDAWFAFEVAAAAAGAAVTHVDLNEWRPNTSMAFLLRVVSASESALHTARPDGTSSGYERARANSDQFFQMPDNVRNTVACANLGPAMGIMALASLIPQVDVPMLYSAFCPEVRNPKQNWVFKNIGRR
jgi:hypothetical protein